MKEFPRRTTYMDAVAVAVAVTTGDPQQMGMSMLAATSAWMMPGEAAALLQAANPALPRESALLTHAHKHRLTGNTDHNMLLNCSIQQQPSLHQAAENDKKTREMLATSSPVPRPPSPPPEK